MGAAAQASCRLLAAALADEATLVSFVQKVLGCGCPVETILTGRLTPVCRPLRDYLVKESKDGWEGLSPRLAARLGLPEGTAWPEPPQPWDWKAVESLPAALNRLQRLCAATADLLIDVPGRALFVLAASEGQPDPAALEDLHAACSLVKDLAGYNRVRLFTLSHQPAAPLPVIDTALTWQRVLDLLRSHGAAWAATAISAALTAA
jgi:hypothetical protein